MTLGNPHIETIAGTWNRETISGLRRTLENSGEDRRSRETVMHGGQEFVIAFAWYLVEYVEGEIAKRNTGGL